MHTADKSSCLRMLTSDIIQQWNYLATRFAIVDTEAGRLTPAIGLWGRGLCRFFELSWLTRAEI